MGLWSCSPPCTPHGRGRGSLCRWSRRQRAPMMVAVQMARVRPVLLRRLRSLTPSLSRMTWMTNHQIGSHKMIRTTLMIIMWSVHAACDHCIWIQSMVVVFARHRHAMSACRTRMIQLLGIGVHKKVAQRIVVAVLCVNVLIGGVWFGLECVVGEGVGVRMVGRQ